MTRNLYLYIEFFGALAPFAELTDTSPKEEAILDQLDLLWKNLTATEAEFLRNLNAKELFLGPEAVASKYKLQLSTLDRP
jgi:hypothetical protein